MINHTRTLLLNRARDGHAPDGPGEEYVVPKYRPRRLRGPVQQAWSLLFGTNPDRLFLNYRLRQIMTVIHASELAAYTTYDDPRITYLPLSVNPFASAFGVGAVRLVGDSDAPFVFGTPLCDEGLGRCQVTWRITFLSDVYGRIEEISAPIDRGDAGVFEYAITAGLSSIITIPGANFSLRFRAPAVDDTWLITTSARPQTDLGELFAATDAIVGPAALADLFADGAPALYRVWTSFPDTMTRYAAMLLALANNIAQSPLET